MSNLGTGLVNGAGNTGIELPTFDTSGPVVNSAPVVQPVQPASVSAPAVVQPVQPAAPAPVNNVSEWLNRAAPVVAATPDPNLWSSCGIQALKNNAGQMGPQPAVPTQGPALQPMAVPAFKVDFGGGPTASEANAAVAVVSLPRVYVVERGDTAFKIAQRFYGDGNRYTQICAENQMSIERCSKLRSGQKLHLSAK